MDEATKRTVRKACDTAVQNLVEYGHVIPILLVKGLGGEAIVALAGDKYRAIEQAGWKVAFLLPQFVTYVTEAWMARRMPPKGMTVSEMPDRQECISILIQAADGTADAVTVPFDRVGGRIVLGETMWPPEGTEVQANILEPFWFGVVNALRRRKK